MNAQVWLMEDFRVLKKKKVKTYSDWTLSWMYSRVTIDRYCTWFIQFRWSHDWFNDKNDTMYKVIKFYVTRKL